MRAALQRKYRWLFVDEFQDTDPIQAEVILLLAADAGRAARDWTRGRRSGPGALFVVGDPKQSIYRFRRADIDIYMRGCGSGIQRDRRRGRRRSRRRSARCPALCDWANAVFPRLLPPAPTPQQPAFHRLDPVRERRRRRGATGVRTLTSRRPSAERRRRLRPTPRPSPGSSAPRSTPGGAGAGDFLVLTRGRRALHALRRAPSTRWQIPVEVSGSARVRRSRRSRCWPTPADARRSRRRPAAGRRAARAALRAERPRPLPHRAGAAGGFLVTAPAARGRAGPVAEALRALREMYRWTRSLPAPAAVERILEETGLAGRRRRGRRRAARRPAISCTPSTACARSRRRAARSPTPPTALEEDLEASEVESVPLEPGRSDVVRLMNLHKAKGLEAPVVFLADPLGGVHPTARTSASCATARRRAGTSRSWRRAQGDMAAPCWPSRPAGRSTSASELAYVEAEEHRLLYVAATRAQDLLVVSRWAKSGGRASARGSAFKLAPRRGAGAQDPRDGRAARAAARRSERLPARAARRPRARPRLTALPASLLARRVRHRHRPPRRALRAAPPGGPHARARHRHGLGPPDPRAARARHARPRARPRAPRAAGQLARPSRTPSSGGSSPRRSTPSSASWPPTSGSAPWRRRSAGGGAVRRAAARDDGTPRVLHGVIDLAFRTPDGWELVDYKTDQARAERLVEQYRDQLDAYATHWERRSGQAVATTALYAVRHGLHVNVPRPVSPTPPKELSG